ncbi:MAG: AMP-binding protein [Desulfurococcaceae archaeon]
MSALRVLEKLYSRDFTTPPTLKCKTVSIEEYLRIYRESISNIYSFWGREASELLWVKPWTTVATGEPPRTKWFIGGALSAYHNIIGRHRDSLVWSKVAVIWEGEEGDARAVTYRELDELASRVASALRARGIRPGDWVVVYTPPVIEGLAVMLAAVKIGAPFEPVFTGFGYWELARRAARRGAKLIFTVDGYYRRGRLVNTLETVRRAVEYSGFKGEVVVIERAGPPSLRSSEVAFSDFTRESSVLVEDYVAESDHPLFGLHSGYLEDYKPITHPTGGFLVQVHSTSKWIGLRPRDTYFCTVWPGWITGVSYVVFGPLMIGSTVVLYDGGPDYPSWDRWWSVIEDYAVTLLLTTSGALRVLSKQGDNYVLKHNLDTLRAILVTAEPLEVDVWWWTYRVVGTGRTPFITSVPGELTGRIPVVNLYIQSEIGTFITGNLVNYTFPPLLPGSAGPPIPGFHVDVVDSDGRSVVENIGELVLREPWPSMLIEYPEEYAEKWRYGYYRTGDYAYSTREGYIYVLGRLDGVVKSSGYRISPGSIEKTLKDLLGVEVAVLKCRDPVRFESIIAICAESPNCSEIKQATRTLLGPIVEPTIVATAPLKTVLELRSNRNAVLEECSLNAINKLLSEGLN